MTEAEALVFYRDAYAKAHARAEALEKQNTYLFEQDALHTEREGIIRRERDDAVKSLAEETRKRELAEAAGVEYQRERAERTALYDHLEAMLQHERQDRAKVAAYAELSTRVVKVARHLIDTRARHAASIRAQTTTREEEYIFREDEANTWDDLLEAVADASAALAKNPINGGSHSRHSTHNHAAHGDATEQVTSVQDGPRPDLSGEVSTALPASASPHPIQPLGVFTDQQRIDWLAENWPSMNMDVWWAAPGHLELEIDGGGFRLVEGTDLRDALDGAMTVHSQRTRLEKP